MKNKVVVGILAIVCAWFVGGNVIEGLKPVTYTDCFNEAIGYGNVYKNEEAKQSPYGYTEAVTRQGVDGEKRTCRASKKGYNPQFTTLREPVSEEITYTANPAPQPTVQQFPQVQNTYEQDEQGGAICRDGWRSYSTGRGTCSHHGGVAEWL